MSSTNKTPGLGLNQWVLTDPFLMEDMNADNSKIDSAVSSLAMVKLGHIITAASCQTIDLDMTGIDWSKYYKVVIYWSLKHNGQSDKYVYSMVRGNSKSGDADYYCGSLGNSSAVGSYFFAQNEAVYSSFTPSYLHKIEIYPANECTLLGTDLAFGGHSGVNIGLLKALTSGSAPLPLSQLQTLNFSCVYGPSAGLTDTVYLQQGCEFEIYGVKK